MNFCIFLYFSKKLIFQGSRSMLLVVLEHVSALTLAVRPKAYFLTLTLAVYFLCFSKKLNFILFYTFSKPWIFKVSRHTDPCSILFILFQKIEFSRWIHLLTLGHFVRFPVQANVSTMTVAVYFFMLFQKLNFILFYTFSKNWIFKVLGVCITSLKVYACFDYAI